MAGSHSDVAYVVLSAVYMDFSPPFNVPESYLSSQSFIYTSVCGQNISSKVPGADSQGRTAATVFDTAGPRGWRWFHYQWHWLHRSKVWGTVCHNTVNRFSLIEQKLHLSQWPVSEYKAGVRLRVLHMHCPAGCWAADTSGSWYPAGIFVLLLARRNGD